MLGGNSILGISTDWTSFPWWICTRAIHDWSDCLLRSLLGCCWLLEDEVPLGLPCFESTNSSIQWPPSRGVSLYSTGLSCCLWRSTLLTVGRQRRMLSRPVWWLQAPGCSRAVPCHQGPKFLQFVSGSNEVPNLSFTHPCLAALLGRKLKKVPFSMGFWAPPTKPVLQLHVTVTFLWDLSENRLSQSWRSQRWSLASNVTYMHTYIWPNTAMHWWRIGIKLGHLDQPDWPIYSSWTEYLCPSVKKYCNLLDRMNTPGKKKSGELKLKSQVVWKLAEELTLLPKWVADRCPCPWGIKSFQGKNGLEHACEGFEAHCNNMKSKLNKRAVKTAAWWVLWKVSCNLSRLV